MKKLITIALIASTCLYYGCQSIENEAIEPVVTQKTNAEGRNLRPSAGEKPDLKVFPFFVNGTVTSTATHYRIPFSLKELNVGTANDTGAYADTLKVYQRMPLGFGYYNRLVGDFLRTQNIPMGSSTYMNNVVMFPRAWRPASGKIHLIVKADGNNTISELDETNNFSDTIWNIVLPL